MTQEELLLDCLRRLNRVKAEYYLTGSMASNFWGTPRTTHDIDFVIRLTKGEVRGLVDEFSNEFYADEASVLSAFAPPYQFNFLDQRSALKVDFWLPKREPFDLEMLARRTLGDIEGVPVWIATPEDVILHKLVWHRISPSQRQLLDAAGVFAVQGESLDRAYMEKWARKLGVEKELQDILSGAVRPKST